MNRREVQRIVCQAALLWAVVAAGFAGVSRPAGVARHACWRMAPLAISNSVSEPDADDQLPLAAALAAMVLLVGAVVTVFGLPLVGFKQHRRAFNPIPVGHDKRPLPDVPAH